MRILKRKRAAIGVLVAFLILGAFGAWQWHRVELRNAEIAAQEARMRSVLEEFEKRADKPVAETLADIKKFKKAFIAELPRVAGSPASQQALVERGIRYLDRVAAAPRGNAPMPPDLSLELADAYEQLAGLQASLSPAKAASASTIKKAAGVLEACDVHSPNNAAVQARLNRLRTQLQAMGAMPPRTVEEPVVVKQPAPVVATKPQPQQGMAQPGAAAVEYKPVLPPEPEPTVVTPPPPAQKQISVELQERLASVEARVQVAEQSIEPVRKNLEAQSLTLSPTIMTDLSSMKVRLNQAKRAMAIGNEASALDHMAAARALADRVLKAIGR